MRFDLVDLRLFMAVLEAGSITAGAARANLALASASARVRGMEEMIGTQLLVRSRGGTVATPAGEALAHHARLLLQQSERMQSELSRYGKGLKGHLRLWSNTAALSTRLPGDLGRFLALHPDVDVDLEERTSREVAQAVRQGLIHVGLSSTAVDLDGLQTWHYGEDTLMAMTPAGHPIAARGETSFAEITAQPFVGLTAGNAIQNLIAQHASRIGQPLNYRVRVNRIEAVGELVQAGVGVSILPAADARGVAKSRSVAIMPLPEAWAHRNLAVVVRSREALPEFARQALSHLIGEIDPS